jgi:oligopeptide transport system substrate-binding protein
VTGEERRLTVVRQPGLTAASGRVTRRRALGGSLALMAFLTAACSGGGTTGDSAPDTPTPATSVGPTPTLAPTVDIAATATVRTQRQTLRMPTTEPPTLDPALATDHASVQISIQLFEGLVELDANGQPSKLGADSWTLGDDGRTYTFSLRRDLVWTDGSPVQAADYEFAWRRAIDPRTASDYASLLYPIKNAVRIHTEGLDSQLLGVTARDDHTLVVTLEDPTAHFLRLVSLWTFAPLKRDALEKFGDRWTRPENIVSNGPFRLVDWKHDSQIVLERNLTYPNAESLMPRAILSVFPDDGTGQVISQYESGSLDVFGTGASFEIPASDAERLAADPNRRPEMRTLHQSGTLFLAVNQRKAHLQDPKVRQALGQVIERDTVLRDVLQRVGTPALSLIPDDIEGRVDSHWPGESVDDARKNFADAGFPGGKDFPPITFTFNTSTQWSRLGDYLKQRYKDTLGIELNLEPMEWTAYLRWRRDDGWRDNGDLARGGWFSDFADPFNWYNLIWDSREDPASFNVGWKNDDYDNLVRAASAEDDPALRISLYQQADEILADDYPDIPIFQYGSRTLVRPYVHGFEPERVLSLVRLKRVHLDDDR